MLFTSRWLARMRYNRCTKRLHKGFRHRLGAAANLVRADKNEALDKMMKRKKTTDVCNLPFVFPHGPQSHLKYIVYDKYYCVFPIPQINKPSGANDEGDVVRAYSAWLNRVKVEHPLLESLLEKLKKENKTFVYPAAMAALNHFFITNKFVVGGFFLSITDDNGPSATLVYYRTQPVSADTGIQIDSNLFCLLESLGDDITVAEINNNWCGDIAKSVSAAQKGADTDISFVPLDKTMYATVTGPLKTFFYTQPQHMLVE